MTRETKVGLLVGLSFIILFGLILGGERGTPQRDRHADQTRVPVHTPGIDELAAPPLGQLSARQDNPPRTLPLREAPVGAPMHVVPPRDIDVEAPRTEPVIGRVPQLPELPVPGTGAAWGQVGQADERLAGLFGGDAGRQETPPRRSEPTIGPGQSPPVQKHLVQAGETLTRLARRYYGDERLFRRIFEANRDQLRDENSVRAGMELVIPPLGPRPAGGTPQPRAAAEAAQAAQAYTVQAGDTLIGIARRFYGDGQHYRRILEANRDKLRDEKDLKPGQVLVIPPPLPAEPSRPAESRPQPDRRYAQPPSNVRTVDYDGLRDALRDSTVTRPRTYQVQAGDSLTSIARRMLPDASPATVRRLYETNRNTLASPDRVEVGMVLTMPE